MLPAIVPVLAMGVLGFLLGIVLRSDGDSKKKSFSGRTLKNPEMWTCDVCGDSIISYQKKFKTVSTPHTTEDCLRVISQRSKRSREEVSLLSAQLHIMEHRLTGLEAQGKMLYEGGEKMGARLSSIVSILKKLTYDETLLDTSAHTLEAEPSSPSSKLEEA